MFLHFKETKHSVLALHSLPRGGFLFFSPVAYKLTFLCKGPIRQCQNLLRKCKKHTQFQVSCHFFPLPSSVVINRHIHIHKIIYIYMYICICYCMRSSGTSVSVLQLLVVGECRCMCTDSDTRSPLRFLIRDNFKMEGERERERETLWQCE